MAEGSAHPIRTLIVKNTGAQIAGKIAGSGSAFITSLILARTLGADGYGDFSKVTTYVAMFYLVADFGMNAIYLQHAKTGMETAWQKLLGTRVVLAAGCIGMAAGGLILLPQGNNQGYTDAVRLGILLYSPTILAQAVITSANGFFQNRLWYYGATVAVAVGSLSTLVLVGGLSLLPVSGSFQPAILAHVAGISLTALVSLGLVRRLKQAVTPLFSTRTVSQLFVPAIPLGLTLLCNMVYFRLDTIIMSLTRSSAEVGVYSFAYKVFELPLVLPTFLMNALYPLLLQALQKGQQSYFRLTRKVLFPLLGASLAATGLLWLTAPLTGYIRPEFAAAAPIVRILSLGLPLFFLSNLTMWMLVSTKRQWALFATYGCSMIGVVLTNLYFIPRHGAIAAAWLTVFWEAVVLLTSAIIVTRRNTSPRH